MANYADSYYNTEVTADSVRRPWNNTIFPGNYVAHLNAYRDQNVQSFPGVNFFRAVGAYVVPEGTTTVTAGNYTCKTLSPDLRQDDKPRLDRDFTLLAGDGTNGGGGIQVYRTSVNVVNLAGASDSTITTNPAAVGGVTLSDMAADSDGNFPESGWFSVFNGLAGTKLTSDTTVGVTTDGTDLTKIDPSKEAAILVEVCFYANAPAPDADDLHLPVPLLSLVSPASDLRLIQTKASHMRRFFVPIIKCISIKFMSNHTLYQDQKTGKLVEFISEVDGDFAMVRDAGGQVVYKALDQLIPYDREKGRLNKVATGVPAKDKEEKLPESVVPIEDYRLNLNMASAEQIAKRLPGVGYTTAKRIVELRMSLSGEQFANLKQLENIPRVNWEQIIKDDLIFI